MEKIYNPDHTIQHDAASRTVWVNGPVNCLGRFTPIGFEIYKKFEATGELENQTLDVKIKTLSLVDWDSFVTLMNIHHHIDLKDKIECPL